MEKLDEFLEWQANQSSNFNDEDEKDIQDEIQEDTTSMEEKIEELEKLNK